MFGLEQIKRINKNPSAYYKSDLSDGQTKGHQKKPVETKCEVCGGKGWVLQTRDLHRSEGMIPCPKC